MADQVWWPQQFLSNFCFQSGIRNQYVFLKARPLDGKINFINYFFYRLLAFLYIISHPGAIQCYRLSTRIWDKTFILFPAGDVSKPDFSRRTVVLLNELMYLMCLLQWQPFPLILQQQFYGFHSKFVLDNF